MGRVDAYPADMTRIWLHLSGGPSGERTVRHPVVGPGFPASYCSRQAGNTWEHYTHHSGTRYTYAGACAGLHGDPPELFVGNSDKSAHLVWSPTGGLGTPVRESG